nr:hypothetical protein CFP56_09262 [Quercus suber]
MRHNFKNSASAKASWHALKKKIDKLEAMANSSSNEAPASNNKRPAEAMAAEEDGEASGVSEGEIIVRPPVKKGKKVPSEQKPPAADGRVKMREAVESASRVSTVDKVSASSNKIPAQAKATADEASSAGSENEITVKRPVKKGKKAQAEKKVSTALKGKGKAKKGVALSEAFVEEDPAEGDSVVAVKAEEEQ